jgi:hypothetical protein
MRIEYPCGKTSTASLTTLYYHDVILDYCTRLTRFLYNKQIRYGVVRI